MKATLQKEVDRLTIDVIGLRAQLRASKAKPSTAEIEEAIAATQQLSTRIQQLGALVAGIKE